MMETTTRELALLPMGWGPEQVMGAWYDWYSGGRLASVGIIKGQGGGSGADINEGAWLRVISTPGWSEPVEAAFVAEFAGQPFPRLRYPLASDPHRLRSEFFRRLAISLLQRPFIPAHSHIRGGEGEELALRQLERRGLEVVRLKR